MESPFMNLDSELRFKRVGELEAVLCSDYQLWKLENALAINVQAYPVMTLTKVRSLFVFSNWNRNECHIVVVMTFVCSLSMLPMKEVSLGGVNGRRGWGVESTWTLENPPIWTQEVELPLEFSKPRTKEWGGFKEESAFVCQWLGHGSCKSNTTSNDQIAHEIDLKA